MVTDPTYHKSESMCLCKLKLGHCGQHILLRLHKHTLQDSDLAYARSKGNTEVQMLSMKP